MVVAFSSIAGNQQTIHIWKAFAKYFHFEYKICRSAEVCKVFSKKIIQKHDVIVTSYEFVRI